MPEKLCVFCVNMEIDQGSSCPTCGYEASISCKKYLMDISLSTISEDEFRKEILKAQTCPEYKPAIPE